MYEAINKACRLDWSAKRSKLIAYEAMANLCAHQMNTNAKLCTIPEHEDFEQRIESLSTQLDELNNAVKLGNENLKQAQESLNKNSEQIAKLQLDLVERDKQISRLTAANAKVVDPAKQGTESGKEVLPAMDPTPASKPTNPEASDSTKLESPAEGSKELTETVNKPKKSRNRRRRRAKRALKPEGGDPAAGEGEKKEESDEDDE